MLIDQHIKDSQEFTNKKNIHTLFQELHAVKKGMKSLTDVFFKRRKSWNLRIQNTLLNWLIFKVFWEKRRRRNIEDLIKENNAVSMENWEGLAKSYEASMKEIFEESANLQSRVGDFETSIKTYFDELGPCFINIFIKTFKKILRKFFIEFFS